MKTKFLIIPLILSIIIISACDNQTTQTQSSPDGGVFKSTDFGENWKQKVFVSTEENKTKTIGNINTNFLIFDPIEEDTIYLVTKGNGIYKTTDGGEQWTKTSLGTGTYNSLSIDALNNRVIYTTDGKKISKTVDGMETWHQIYIENRAKQKITPLVVDYYSSNVVYATTTSGIIKSTDYGNSWKLMNWKKPNIMNLYQSIKDNETLYILSNQGVYKSTDGAVTWINKSAEALKAYKGADKMIWLTFDSRTEYMYLGTGYGIFKSLDSGENWEPVSTLFDFNKISIRAVTHNPNDRKEIIFAVNNLLHKTDDGGKTWKTIKTVPTKRTINYLIADPYHDDVIYLGTYLATQ